MDSDVITVLVGLAVLYLWVNAGAVIPAGAPSSVSSGGSVDPSGVFNSGCTKYGPQLSGLDDASMNQAIWGSWIGAYGLNNANWPIPNFTTTYWRQTFNHWGAYGDGLCRGGWGAYAESRLLGTALGDYNATAVYPPLAGWVNDTPNF